MQGTAITLPETLDVSAFEPLHNILSDALKHKGALRLDGSKVERLTTPCAQLLASLLQTGAAAKNTKLVRPSAAMHAAWNDLGLTAQFPLEAAE
jgi:anti-anti-sigma regulatory factor